MRVTISKPSLVKGFEPFDFTIHIRCVEDAQVLWHRLNICYNTVRLNTSGGCELPRGESADDNMWEVLDKYMDKNNLLK